MATLPGGSTWGADVPISMPDPIPPDRIIYVDMDGFCFTLAGLGHNFNEADLETFTIPTFGPDPFGTVGEVLG